jgi:hypothetical protein
MRPESTNQDPSSALAARVTAIPISVDNPPRTRFLSAFETGTALGLGEGLGALIGMVRLGYVQLVYHALRCGKSQDLHFRKRDRRPCQIHSFVVALTFLLAACGASSQSDAIQRTTAGLIQSIETNDLREMAKYVVREDGSPCTPEELKELLERERPSLLTRLAQANATRTRVQVRYEYFVSNEHNVTVISEFDRYHVRNVLRIDACPSSIEGALRLLSEYVRSHYQLGGTEDFTPNFLTVSSQQQWFADAKIWTDSLASPEELDVEDFGAKAIVRLPTGHTVELTNEFDCWRIERVR